MHYVLAGGDEAEGFGMVHDALGQAIAAQINHFPQEPANFRRTGVLHLLVADDADDDVSASTYSVPGPARSMPAPSVALSAGGNGAIDAELDAVV